MSNRLLFTVTRRDLDVQFFCTGGPGGQKQNKTASGCRIVHRDSGAVGESRELRSQAQNRKRALERLVESKTFRAWVRVQASAREQGFRDLEAKVDKAMDERNIKVEFYDPEAR